ncbi:O-antigen ligase family protein [Pleurocapsales cyanobacterium LEGE 06147]|nr:O-antigen ligase family protein [Pleurocapsales cyanobacterium LEGE 06147]
MTQFISLWRDFEKCLKIAPLPILSLIIYMGLRSSTIDPRGLGMFNGVFHPAYFGWYDLVLGYSILISLFLGRIKIDGEDLFFILMILSIIVISWTNIREPSHDFLVASIVFFLRFSLTFILGKSLVYSLGIKTSESILIVLFAILALSSLFVFQLQLGINNRLFAAAMTSASFSQVSVIVALIAYLRKNNWLLFISVLFTLLTFSRFSLLFLGVLIIVYHRKLISWTVLRNVVLIVGLSAIIIFGLLKFGGEGYEAVFASRFSSEEFSSLSGRTYIWSNAVEILQSGRIPLLGVGFHTTPSLIKEISLEFFNEYEGTMKAVPHFHSIFIEYGFGLGILSFFIFFYLFKRVWQTFYYSCYPSFFIFAFFVLSQSCDYTFYPPKEIIIWSLMLGMAEGQWRYNSRGVNENNIAS